MAPLRQPQTLQKLCIDRAGHILLCYAISGNFDKPSKWKILGQYVDRYIPPSFRTDVLHVALKKLGLQDMYFIRPETVTFLLKLLLHTFTKELSMSELIYAGETTYEMLDSFEIVLSDNLPPLPCLTYLDLSTHRTEVSLPSCSYSVLCVIGKHCPNLRILNLNYNNRVTGDGIRCLAPSKFNVGCPLLEEIYVQDCSLRTCDIIWLLQNFKNLRNVGYQDMGTILQKFRSIFRRRRYRLPKLKLTHLDNTESTCRTSDRNVIRLVGEMCPYVDNLRVRVYDRDVTELYYLKSITKLELRFYTGIHHPIGEETIAYLKADGRYLTSLTIYCARLESYHVTTVASHCVNLKKLFLYSNSFEETDESFYDVRNRLDGLRILSIRVGQHEMDESPSADFLASYLIEPCTKLQEIYLLLRCTDVNVNFLTRCLRRNPLQHLKIFMCDAPRRNQSLPMVHLGFQAALVMIEQCPQLDTIGNLISWSISSAEVDDLKKILQMHNLDVSLIYSLSNKMNKKYF